MRMETRPEGPGPGLRWSVWSIVCTPVAPTLHPCWVWGPFCAVSWGEGMSRVGAGAPSGVGENGPGLALFDQVDRQCAQGEDSEVVDGDDRIS